MKKKTSSSIMSAIIWGSGQFFVCKQRIRGLLFFTVQLILILIELISGYWFNFFAGEISEFKFGLYGGYFSKGIWGLLTLGSKSGRNGDHSTILLINGIITLLILILFLVVYILNIKDAYNVGKKIDSSPDNYNLSIYNKSLKRKMFPYIVIFPIVIIIIFVVLMPILFSVSTAFTNYDSNHLPPAHLIDWTGFKNFKRLFTIPIWSTTFFAVLGWNIIWAVCATLTTYIMGLFQALILNSKYTKFKTGFRIILILPWAIPGMISLLVFRNLLNGQFGPINQFLLDIGLIDNRIPFLTDPIIAKISVIMVNLWLAFPAFMVMLLGVLSNQDPSLYEAASIDGANKFQIFYRIKLPQLLHATAPLIVMNFAANFNAFGSIYFLTNGGPVNPKYQFAGDTDILISWIYKLTLDQRLYSMAAVMNILIFILIGTFSFWNIRRTSSYKEV